MTSFLSFHATAAARGDGLRLELLALRVAAVPHSHLTPRPDGMIQSGPDPASVGRGRTGDASAPSVIASVATAPRNDSSEQTQPVPYMPKQVNAQCLGAQPGCFAVEPTVHSDSQ